MKISKWPFFCCKNMADNKYRSVNKEMRIIRFVLSRNYKNVLENKNYVLTNFYMYISASKNGSQYLDSLGGAAGVSDSGSYTCNTFLLEAEEKGEKSL